MDDGGIKHFTVDLPDEASKIDLITQTILSFGATVNQTIIFVNTRETADILHKALEDFEYDPTILHYRLSEEKREEKILQFNEEFYRVIVTTDLTIDSRIDPSLVNLVINFDLPIIHSKEETEKEPRVDLYLQRSSIKGRICFAQGKYNTFLHMVQLSNAGPGAVFNLLCGNKDQMIMNKIECHPNLSKTKVTSWKNLEDFESAYRVADMF